MELSEDVQKKINAFSEQCLKKEKELAEIPLDKTSIEEYNRSLEETLRNLQDRLQQQEAALQNLRASKSTELPRPGLQSHERLSQIRRAKKAYEKLTASEPDLPPPESALPGVLALRETFQLIQETKSSISTVHQDFTADSERRKTEESNLRDARLITDSLEERISQLRTQRSQKEKKSASQLAKELIQTQRKKKSGFEKDAIRLREALENFVDEHLAPMIAAEDLGGPTVGDEIDVPDLTLESGYTNQGKPKKPKSTADAGADSRQQRIDELINRQTGAEDDEDSGPTTKRGAAGAEMITLLNDLLEAANSGTGAGSYVELSRDSAASRFLVKAKIAQFHPRDARRLRLIDFAREITI
ncbi:hypothetical protein FQN54_007795 [Arachnomyces sp. PD_36]|nr:hypothetical protein FQN54_007795 [Arachnomyces sp. PD_36]